MNIQFHQRDHVELPSEARDYITQRLQTFLIYEPKLTLGEVVVMKEGEEVLVECLVKGPHHFEAVAKARQYNLRRAMDEALAKLEVQLKKHKEKVKEKRTI